jgi:hypothetical protein
MGTLSKLIIRLNKFKKTLINLKNINVQLVQTIVLVVGTVVDVFVAAPGIRNGGSFFCYS